MIDEPDIGVDGRLAGDDGTGEPDPGDVDIVPQTDMEQTRDGSADANGSGGDQEGMGSDADGDTFPDVSWDRSAEARVTDNLLLLYTFEEGNGTTVLDRAHRGGTSALSLEAGVDWLSDRNGVSITADGVLTSMPAGAEIYDAVVGREELTVEVWFEPANLTQDRPARIVTYSSDHAHRNFTVGQERTAAAFRLRTNDESHAGNGEPSLEGGSLSLSETQMVMTYDGVELKGYVDGTEVVSERRYGGFQSWSRNHLFLVGNEAVEPRPWAGEVYRIAVYDRALSPDEVQRNFNGGSAP